MKATGIVRRIDDLGRVVIPKEIRRTMRIREGDPLEIYTDREGGVILKKYSPINELNQFAGEFIDSAYSILGDAMVVTDTDQVVAVSGGSRKDYLDKRISTEIEKIIQGKTSRLVNDGEAILPITLEEGENGDYKSQIVVPIISQGDPIGSVIYFTKENGRQLGDVELKTAEIGAHLLAKQMEN
ncbi:MAG: stage V sporulation protein T [Eubacteriales bacterium]|nr:stage V sporulation protein T [Eubacteriales bacterium]